jgi:hypothetical protein
VDRRRILIAGIGASLVLAMWEMIVEAVIPDGAGFFGPPIAIGATIVRDLQGSANPIPFDLTMQRRPRIVAAFEALTKP